MNIKPFEGNALNLDLTPYFTIQKDGNSLFIVEFDSPREMDSYIEDICVSMGEDGEKDNFIYQSMTYEQLHEGDAK